MAIEWYRRKSWTKIDEEEFFAKLGRARKSGRAQYLKIQAIELVDTKEIYLLNIAKVLLQKILTDYPEDIFYKSTIFSIFGDIYLLENDIEKSIECYKHAIDLEKIYISVKTDAYLKYSELIIKNQFKNLYTIVEEILEQNVSHLLFPLEKYKVFSILSIINKYNSKTEIANKYAELADKNAQASTSGLRYHKYLGIVSERDDFLDEMARSNNY
ncbi:hypothetical protein KHA90_08770 [Flavobacterium psychroterrae]|uniref:Tetratricopeptide repeat protein n=1 Tax=Flavobacterium psychroterrae TaxID=2133767 RepID=A0ABS5PA13_9FLAO|nr:hypothetical protein [Flavobacterium psychroterrae]MBS7231116.1 hypothetical protein [Flavobacterium psychroterrae]